MGTLRQAEYADAKKVMEILKKYDNNYYIKHDFNINTLNTEKVRFYIFEFQVLFFLDENETNVIAVKLPLVYERQNSIEILMANNNISLWEELLKIVRAYSKEFGWDYLRISLINELEKNSLIKILNTLGFKKVAMLSSIYENYKRVIYEIDLKGDN